MGLPLFTILTPFNLLMGFVELGNSLHQTFQLAICNQHSLNLYSTMKIVRFAVDNKVKYGILSGESVQAIEDKPYRYLKLSDRYYQLDEVKLLSPCLPSKIVALGLNYHSHAEEVNASLPNAPLIFLKPSTAVIGPEDNIVYPASSARVDYEGELAVVIKKPVWRV